MEKIPSSHTWVKFFQDAGIPDDLSAQYAVMFTDHRIHRDMLSELDREILSDIGVKAVGDKMAILKHARFISEQSKRDASSKELASGLKKPPKASAASPKVSARPNPNTVPVPKKKIKLITTAVSRTVDKNPRAEQAKDVPAVPKTEKRSVFQRLGGEGNPSVVFNRLGECDDENLQVQSMPRKTATPSILSRLGGEITELPDSSTGTSASQRRNIKKVVTLKKKATESTLQSRPMFNNNKKPSILDRLGQKADQNIASEKLDVASKLNIVSLVPKKNMNLIKIPSKRKQEVDPVKLVVTMKKPISSNAVSSTSAGLFRGAAESGSSVFDRLGPK